MQKGDEESVSTSGESVKSGPIGVPSSAMRVSRTALWDSYYSGGNYQRQVYGDDTTVRKAAAFLNDPAVHIVEDWGCGYGGAKLYLAPHQQYIGVDGSRSRFADRIADLEHYKSTSDGVLLRHVLDHNPNWEAVLDNALCSFTRRMALIFFTPWQISTRVLREYPNWEGTGQSMWDIGFRRDDVLARLGSVRWSSEENLRTRTGYGVEHIFYLFK